MREVVPDPTPDQRLEIALEHYRGLLVAYGRGHERVRELVGALPGYSAPDAGAVLAALEPGGRFFMHVFVHRGTPYAFEPRDEWKHPLGRASGLCSWSLASQSGVGH